MAETLANEAEAVKRIKASIRAKNLTPPASANAYSLLKTAVTQKALSRENQESLTQELEEQLVTVIKQRLPEASTQLALDEVGVLIAHLKLVNAKSSQLQSFMATAEEAQTAFDEAAQAQAEDEKNQPQIAPAKLLSRKAPKYPSRALQRNLEGWVEVAFRIDTEGNPIDVVVKASEPSNVFESAAVRALKDWRFLPAMDIQTGQPVVTEMKSTRMNFKLESNN